MWRSVLVSSFVFLLPALAVHAEEEAPTSPDAPNVLGHYYMVPESSTLHITGGFAGVDQTYSVTGEYDFNRFFRSGERYATFRNVDLVSPIFENGFPAYVDVTELLGLEALTGQPLPLAAPFEVYHFEGETFDHMGLDLYAAVMGPWMYLHGTSQAPAGSADHYEYELQALARTRPWSDENGDRIVDAADYTAMRDRGATAGELDNWRAQYGEQAPDMGQMQLALATAFSAATLNAAAVPEPGTGCLLFLSVLAVAFRRRRK